MRPSIFAAAVALFALLSGCAGSAGGPPRAEVVLAPGNASPGPVAARAAAIASRQVGAPYRYGGRTPTGFDCSGLVLYSYAGAGVEGLPHSAAALERQARAIGLAELAPGDLLFFRLGGAKADHVGIYLGGDTFVHAPSSGRHVETVRFDHVYWGPRIRRAGRLTP